MGDPAGNGSYGSNATPLGDKPRSSTSVGTSRSYGRIGTTLHGSYGRSTAPGSATSNFGSNVRVSIINTKTKKHFKSPGKSREKDWKASKRTFDVGYGYEKSWRSARTIVPGSRETCLQKEARCPTPEWKPVIRCIEKQRGGTLEVERYKPLRKCSTITPRPDSQEQQWKPSRRVIRPQHVSMEWTINANRRHFSPPISKTATTPQISHKSAGMPPPSTWDFSPPKVVHRSVECSKRSTRQYFSQHPPLRLFTVDGDNATPVPCSYTIFPQKTSGKKSVPDYNADHPQYHVCSSELDDPCISTLQNIGASDQ